MASWGNTDDAANSVIWAAAQLNKPANTSNQTALFGNTTPDAFVTGKIVGQFAVDNVEVAVANGSIVRIEVTSPGSGYSANATVTLSGNATANATANSIGKISAVNIVSAGSGYAGSPTLVISDPTAQAFNANTSVSANGFIAIAANPFQVGDRATYTVSTGNTAIAELTSGRKYYVKASNSTGVYLSNGATTAVLTLTKGLTEGGHSLTGETATAAASVSASKKGVAHAGYVLRTVGTGGRAGRVQFETLVAMGSMTGDAEDTIMKDS